MEDDGNGRGWRGNGGEVIKKDKNYWKLKDLKSELGKVSIEDELGEEKCMRIVINREWREDMIDIEIVEERDEVRNGEWIDMVMCEEKDGEEKKVVKGEDIKMNMIEKMIVEREERIINKKKMRIEKKRKRKREKMLMKKRKLRWFKIDNGRKMKNIKKEREIIRWLRIEKKKNMKGKGNVLRKSNMWKKRIIMEKEENIEIIGREGVDGI